ncbi:DUF1350 family protein [Oculatella sp. LEGE 06141]|uniref:DUF1350 family protein n=1 Tax=Oculatella sp. LEGE 06141 TaxID=1828648 RepID=UPI0018828D4E|nr:DUF1350 family protein [Oculatella sp. LEGE 06141]MBE9177691.1 DUF1350 family protein [Oculatella sp. LEGE 06141]
MNLIFKPISHSWVAKHPHPIGVVEFLGGALYGSSPTIGYSHFLSSLFEAGYTVIAVPFSFGFNHEAIAQSLLVERDVIRQELNYPDSLPHFWIGHSLGCKYIMLLEALDVIFDQPSLLITPCISDTKDALPSPSLARWFDRHQLGVRPTKQATQELVHNSDLFNLTALLSCRDDAIAGNQQQLPETSDVAWFAQQLIQKQGDNSLCREIAGGHREVLAVRLGRYMVDWQLNNGLLQTARQRSVEQQALHLLQQLGQRLNAASAVSNLSKVTAIVPAL